MLSSGRTAVQRLRHLASPSVVARCMSSDYGGGHHKSAVEVAKEHRATLNDLPVPQGSWQEHHNKRNMTFNIILGAGIAMFITTYFIMKQVGCFYFHGPPDYKKLQINPN